LVHQEALLLRGEMVMSLLSGRPLLLLFWFLYHVDLVALYEGSLASHERLPLQETLLVAHGIQFLKIIMSIGLQIGDD